MPLSIPYRIHLPDGTSHDFEQFGDISLGGCQVSSKEEFEMYLDCNIEILLGDKFDEGSKVEIYGKIMRIGYDFTGIKFIRMGTESLELLQSLLSFNAADPEKIHNEFKQHLGVN